MWTNKKSILLTKYMVNLLLVLVVIFAVALPWIANWYCNKRIASVTLVNKEALVMVSGYICIVFAVVILIFLRELIKNILIDKLFVEENIKCLRYISWCCFAIALCGAISTVYYAPWIFIFVAAGFMGLILRVIKNVFEKAKEIKEENDYTV